MHMGVNKPGQDVPLMIVFLFFNTQDLSVFNGNLAFELPPGNGIDNNPQVLDRKSVV